MYYARVQKIGHQMLVGIPTALARELGIAPRMMAAIARAGRDAYTVKVIKEGALSDERLRIHPVPAHRSTRGRAPKGD
jgi:hypothetical protein